MNSVICTLFENHFHKGLVALINSLHANGYKGDIYVGYLGSLPEWAKINENSMFEKQAIETFVVNESIRIQFIPLKTDHHLTNYKPDFMKWVLSGPAGDAENIFYFDPDIVIDYNWNFFEEWAGFGVAVCEDVNSPLSLNHPRRMAWHKYFNGLDIPLKFDQTAYANGGFVGLNRKDYSFISSWIMIQEHIAPVIGGLQNAFIPGKNRLLGALRERYFAFNKTDQDALNITIGTWDGVVSFTGQEAMAFKPGSELMFHALGNPKPWSMKFLRKALKGFRPRRVDKLYWKSVSYPIKLYSNGYLFWKILTLNIASVIGRFYGKY